MQPFGGETVRVVPGKSGKSFLLPISTLLQFAVNVNWYFAVYSGRKLRAKLSSCN